MAVYWCSRSSIVYSFFLLIHHLSLRLNHKSINIFSHHQNYSFVVVEVFKNITKLLKTLFVILITGIGLVLN